MDNFHLRIARIAEDYAASKVPYRHRGVSRKGCDCTGLPLAIIKELGYLKNYKLRLYAPDWNLHTGADNKVIEELERFGDRVDNYSPGDIIVFRFGKCPSHVGIYIGRSLFVHCLRTAGKCTRESLLNKEWKGRVFFVYRLNMNKLRLHS